MRSSGVFAHCYCFHSDGLCLFLSVCGSNARKRMLMSTAGMHPEAMVLPLCQKTLAIEATLYESLSIDTSFLRLVKSVCNMDLVTVWSTNQPCTVFILQCRGVFICCVLLQVIFKGSDNKNRKYMFLLLVLLKYHLWTTSCFKMAYNFTNLGPIWFIGYGYAVQNLL